MRSIARYISMGFLICLLAISAKANVISINHSDCLRLGSDPSLIMRFKNSNSYSEINPVLLNQLTTRNAVFTQAKPIAARAYIVHFKPSSSLLKKQIQPGCYAKQAIDKLIEKVKQRANLESVTPNILYSMASLPPHFAVPVVDPVQWDLLTPPGGMDAQTAYNTTTGSSNAIIAVLDTGVLDNLSLNPNLYSAGVTFNDNGSWAVGATPSCDATCGGYDHGTHVSGTVAASGVLAYGKNIYGVAPTARVLPVNVFTKFTSEVDCGVGNAPCLLSYTSDQINALSWLLGTTFTTLPVAPAVVGINMSLGGLGSCDATVQNLFSQLIAANVSIAVAAGNSNADASLYAPASCTGVMAVAATGPAGYGAYYSNYGAIVPFAAPGGDATGGVADTIYSTIENAYGYKQGTSMASPHVAGLTALLYSVDPTLTPTTVLSLLQSTATAFPVGGPGNSCTALKPCGTGIVDANSAVLAAVAQAPILTWTPGLTLSTPGASQVTISWQAAAWSPVRSTQIAYAVYLDGVAYSGCQNLVLNHCDISGLSANSAYSVYVTASDYRNIYAPVQSAVLNFTTNAATAPVLTVAQRDPLKLTRAYLYYSSLGTSGADTYHVNGMPSGATITLDANRNRFVVDHVDVPESIANVSVSAFFGVTEYQSNSVTIPNIL